MSNAPQLQPVLDRIDAISTTASSAICPAEDQIDLADPAFAGDCKARRSSSKDIASLGFATEVRPTAGHPAIVANQWGREGKRAAAPIVSMSLHVAAGRSAQSLARPPFERPLRTMPTGEKSSSLAVQDTSGS